MELFPEIPHKKILAVFAHPDDDELTCFGSLSKFRKQGANVSVLELTKGENSFGITSYRSKETKASAQLSGYSLYAEELSDGSLVYNIELVALIEKYLNMIKPDIVITHFPQTLGLGHQDHDVVASALVNAARRKEYVQCILYAEPPTTNATFVPNLFIDITDYLTLKQDALKIHRSEENKDYISSDVLECKSKWWAFQAHPAYFNSHKYYEAFVIVKCIVN